MQTSPRGEGSPTVNGPNRTSGGQPAATSRGQAAASGFAPGSSNRSSGAIESIERRHGDYTRGSAAGASASRDATGSGATRQGRLDGVDHRARVDDQSVPTASVTTAPTAPQPVATGPTTTGPVATGTVATPRPSGHAAQPGLGNPGALLHQLQTPVTPGGEKYQPVSPPESLLQLAAPDRSLGTGSETVLPVTVASWSDFPPEARNRGAERRSTTCEFRVSGSDSLNRRRRRGGGARASCLVAGQVCARRGC